MTVSAYRISSPFYLLMFYSSSLRCSAGGNIIGMRKIQEEFVKCARAIVGYSPVDQRRLETAELILGRWMLGCGLKRIPALEL